MRASDLTLLAGAFVVVATAACSTPSGTPTSVVELRQVTLDVHSPDGASGRPETVDQRLTGDVLLEVSIGLAGAERMDATGDSCPVLRADATASIDGSPATFLERGGPQPSGLISTDSYHCAGIRFVSSALRPPYDVHTVAITLADASGFLQAEFEGLLVARAAALSEPPDGTSVVAGSVVQIALPAGSSATPIDATLWQMRADGAWGGTIVPTLTSPPGTLAVSIELPPGGPTLLPGRHLLEARINQPAPSAVSCSAGATCTATPIDRVGPFAIDIAPP